VDPCWRWVALENLPQILHRQGKFNHAFTAILTLVKNSLEVYPWLSQKNLLPLIYRR
jgi:hypothetical protein